MRILIVGAGAIGGYFGGRLLQAGRDVTFLVRARRAAQLAAMGLVIKSPAGDVHYAKPPIVTAETLREPFDLILLSCKAYDLDDAIAAFAPAVGPTTTILPLLNGMQHLDVLDAGFGRDGVLGGLALISSALDDEGRILHLNDFHGIVFGARTGEQRQRAEAVAKSVSDAGFDARSSETILQEMWEKWIFIAVLAGLTSLMRAPVGDILTAGGSDLATVLLDECAAVATSHGFPPGGPMLQRVRAMLSTAGSPLTASMLRDIEGGGRTEAEHILGDLLRRAGTQADPRSLLRIAYTHVAAYESRRERMAKAT